MSECLKPVILRCEKAAGHDGQLIAGNTSSNSRISCWKSLRDYCVLSENHSLFISKVLPVSADEEEDSNLFSPVKGSCSTSLLHNNIHRTEITDISTTKTNFNNSLCVATIDSSGTICVTSLSSELTLSATKTIPPTSPSADFGNNGVSFQETNPTLVARCRPFDSSVEVIDISSGTTTWKAGMLERPWTLTWVGLKPNEQRTLLAITEGRSISIFDTRINSNNSQSTTNSTTTSSSDKPKPALIHRIDDSTQQLRAINWDSTNGVILAGGDDRGIRAIETHSGSLIGRFSNATKVSISGIYPSQLSNTSLEGKGNVFVRGIDSQLVCGCWGNKKRGRKDSFASSINSLRVDGRWAGMCIQSGEKNEGETIFGWTSLCSLYVIKNAEKLFSHYQNRDTEMPENDEN